MSVTVVDKGSKVKVVAGQASGWIANHLTLPDPHPQYTTNAELIAGMAGLVAEVDAVQANYVTTNTAQDVTAVKTFTANPIFNDAGIPPAKVAGLVADLANRWTKAEADGRFWALTTDLATQVELDAGIAGEATTRANADELLTPMARTLTAGVGLTGGGSLTANRTFNVSYGAVAGTAVEGNDARLVGAAADNTVVHLAGAETITGLKTFTPSAMGAVGLVVRGVLAHNNSLQQWQDGDGNLLAEVEANGLFRGSKGILATGTSAATGFALAAVGSVAGSAVNIVKGAVGQSNDLTQWKNSDGTILAAVSASGIGAFGSRLHAGRTSDVSSWQLSSSISAPGVIGLVVRSATGQTADLQQWQNSAGSVLTRVDAQGRLGVGVVPNAMAHFYGSRFDVLRVEGTDGAYAGMYLNATQTTASPFFSWQRAGVQYQTTHLETGNQLSFRTGNIVGALQMQIGYAASDVRLTVRSAAGQTADLQQWQNSAGSALLGVTASGDLIGNTNGGTKIATSAAQKIGLWGAVPVVQPAGISDAVAAVGLTPTKVEFDAVVSKFNNLITKLETVGILATV